MNVANPLAWDIDAIKSKIAELPRHDSTIPINDESGPDGRMGAHGKANAIEGYIAGKLKAYVVSERLRNLPQDDAAAIQALREIARIVTSPDGGEKDGQLKELRNAKFSNLHLNGQAGDTVRHIVEWAESGDTTPPASLLQEVRSEAVQSNLKKDSVKSVLTPEVRQAAAEKFYDLTENGNVINQSSVRMGRVEGRQTHNGMPLAGGLSESDDTAQKIKAVTTYIKNLKAKGANTLVPENNAVRIFDIAHGTGEVSVAAVKALKEALPGVTIQYTGVDMTKANHPPLEEKLKALGNVETTFITGNFGRPEIEEKLKPLEGKQDLVLASHVYNLGNTAVFMGQINLLQKDNGIAYIAHEKGESWVGDFRKQDASILRGDNDRAAELHAFLDGKSSVNGMPTEKRDFATFSATTHDQIAPLSDKELAIIKSMPQGSYTRDHAQGLNEEERTEFNAKVAVREYFMRSPLEAFSTADRAAVIDSFEKQLKENNLHRPAETQVLLSAKNKDRNLSNAVHQTAREVGAMFEQEERKRIEERFVSPATGTGRVRSGG